MLHESETLPVRKENEVALQRAEMRIVRWMCNVKTKDRVPSKELRERLGIDDIILTLQQNKLQLFGHVLQKDTDWVKNVWNIRWRAPHQTKEDMERGCIKRLPSTKFEQGGCYGSQ